MTHDPNLERSDALARSAHHLADLEARYDAHLAGLRDHAERVRAATEAEAAALERTVSDDDVEPHQP